MKTKVVIGILVALATLVPGAGAKVAGPQEHSGTVLFPTPHPQDPSVCFQGVGRRINMVSQGTVTGPFGEIFDIDKSTWNGKFKLTVTGAASGSADMDLFFFSTFGDIAQDPSMNSPTILYESRERNDKGEVGKVPPTSTKAIACLYDGLAASFDYKATPPKKK